MGLENKWQNLKAAIGFAKDAFSDKGSASSSRLLTAAHSVVACFAVLFVVLKTGHLPEAGSTIALGGFATVHYGVNAARNMFGKDANVGDTK